MNLTVSGRITQGHTNSMTSHRGINLIILLHLCPWSQEESSISVFLMLRKSNLDKAEDLLNSAGYTKLWCLVQSGWLGWILLFFPYITLAGSNHYLSILCYFTGITWLAIGRVMLSDPTRSGVFKVSPLIPVHVFIWKQSIKPNLVFLGGSYNKWLERFSLWGFITLHNVISGFVIRSQITDILSLSHDIWPQPD